MDSPQGSHSGQIYQSSITLVIWSSKTSLICKQVCEAIWVTCKLSSAVNFRWCFLSLVMTNLKFMSPGQSCSFLSYHRKKQCTLLLTCYTMYVSGVENKAGLFSTWKIASRRVCSMVLSAVNIKFWGVGGVRYRSLLSLGGTGHRRG